MSPMRKFSPVFNARLQNNPALRSYLQGSIFVLLVFAFALACLSFHVTSSIAILPAIAAYAVLTGYHHYAEAQAKEVASKVESATDYFIGGPADVGHRPRTSHSADYCTKINMGFEEWMHHFARGTKFQRGLRALIEQRFDEAAALFEGSAEEGGTETAIRYLYPGNTLSISPGTQTPGISSNRPCRT